MNGRKKGGITENKNRIGTAGMIYLLFFVYAVSTGLIGTVLATLLGDFHMDVSGGGWFTFVQYLGSAVGILLSGRLLCRCRKWKLMLVLYAVYAAGMMAVFGVASLEAFLVLLLVIGIATKMIDVTCNTMISQIFSDHKGPYLNFLHACFGIGNILGPVLAVNTLTMGLRWQSVYLIVGIAALVLMLCLIVFLKIGRPPQAGAGQEEKLCVRAMLRKRTMRQLMWILFFYCGHQICVSNWTPMFLSKEYGADTVLAGIGVSSFWLGLIACRLACSWLSAKYQARRLMCIGLAAAAVLHTAGIYSGVLPLAIAGFVAAGLFAGATIPLCLTIGYERYPEAQETVSMLLFLSICAGQIVIPWCLGLLADAYGMSAAMLLNIGSLVISLLIAVRLNRTCLAD